MNIQQDVQLIDYLFVDWCSFLNHEPTRLAYVSGDDLRDVFVDTLTPDGDVIVHDIPLVEVLKIYIETHYLQVIDNSTNAQYAADFYWMLLKNFKAMGIKEFYVPVMIDKHNSKSSFTQFVIVEVPPEYHTRDILNHVQHMVKTNQFIGVAPSDDKSPFTDDGLTVVKNYIELLIRLICLKSLKITSNGITTSD